MALPKETKMEYLECTDFTHGYNSLDDPIDLDKGASPFVMNMDVTKKGKLFARYGYELVSEIAGTDLPMRGLQHYYRTYDDTSAVDQKSLLTGANYTPPVAISESAANKRTFTPSSITKNRIFAILINISAKGTGDFTVTLHDAANTVLATKTITNAALSSGVTQFNVPYTWTSGALHFHVTSTVADGTIVTHTADDLSDGYFQEVYRTSGDYLIMHCGNGNSYYVTNANFTPTTIGAWGTDNGNPVRGTTFNNFAVFGDAGYQNNLKSWDATTEANVPGAPQINIFGVFQKHLFGAGNPNAPSTTYYSDADSIANLGSNFINVTVGDGWDVTSLLPNTDFLQTFKTDTINGINFSFDTNYNITAPQLQPIINSQGGVWATGSAQPIFGYSYYMSKKGFERYGPNPDKVVANSPLPLSLEIEPTFKIINMDLKNVINSTFFDNKYICTAAVGASHVANMCFVYNESVKRRFERDSWTLYNDIPAAAFTLFRNSKQLDELYFVSAFEPKLYKFNNTFSDAGNGYLKAWQSKTFKFGERTNYYYIDFEGVMTLNEVITITATTDGIQHTDTIDKSNLVVSATGGSYVGDSYVGDSYVGGGYTGSAVPVYRFKKRYYFPPSTNYGYNMNFLLSSSIDGEGWGLNRYLLAYKQEPEEPTYDFTT